MSVVGVTGGPNHFMIPAAPAVGTTVAQSASANTFGSYVQMVASTVAALYITGYYVQISAGANIPTYMSLQIGVGPNASEVTVDQATMGFGPTSGVASTAWGVYKPVFPPIPVGASSRIAAKTASSVASALSWAVTLECITQANVADDGIAVGLVTTVTNQLTAAAIAAGVWKDNVAGDFTVASSVGKSVMNGVALGTGLTVNALTTNNDKTGYTLSAAGVSAIWQDTTASDFTTALSIGKSIMNGVTLGTGLTINAYTGDTPQTGDSFVIVKAGGTGDNAAIKAKTDNLPASPASTTNITAGTITTVTNLTNAATAGDLTATMKTSVQTAADAAITANATIIEIAADTDMLLTGVAVLPTANANADALLDRAAGVETGLTVRQFYRLSAGVILGKSSGMNGPSAAFRDTNDTKNRVVASLDGNGGRTAVTLDAS